MRTEPFVIDVTVTGFISGFICGPSDAQILHLWGGGRGAVIESIGGGAGPTRGTGNSNTVTLLKSGTSVSDFRVIHTSLMSSANILRLPAIHSGRSLTNNRNRGPNTDPCGTPLRTLIQSEKLPLTPTIVLAVKHIALYSKYPIW